MSGFTAFSFSNSSKSSSTPSFVFGSSSTSNFDSSSSSSSSSSFVSSSANPFFGSSSSSSSSSTITNQKNDEATIKKIIEAIELLEKKTENGVFPRKKLLEIKQEVENKYPNIFSNNSQNHLANNDLSNSSNLVNQEEFYDNHLLVQEQQMNRYIQSHMSQILKTEQQMKRFGETAPGLSPDYGANYPDYDVNYGNYGDELNSFLSNSGLGSDGCSALSFLGSLLGGFGL